MIRRPLDKFALAVTGGSRLMDLFCCAFQETFTAATLYDRSTRFLAFQRAEIKLGKTKFASPEFRQMALRMERNLKNPPRKVAVTVDFLVQGESEIVTVKGQSERRRVNFRWDYAKEMVDVDKAIRAILDAVATVP